VTLDEGFASKLDNWNNSHLNHPPVMVRWEPRAVRVHKYVWVCGVPIMRWEYQPRWQVGVVLSNKAQGPVTYIEGSGGLWFFKLFTWQRQDTKEFLDLDDRIFQVLGDSDSTQHGFYEERIERPATELEERSQAESRELSYASTFYYLGYDSPTVSLDPGVKAGAGWRHRIR